MKSCKKCNRSLPEHIYHKNKTAPDGLRAICKMCRNKRHPLEEGPERAPQRDIDRILEWSKLSHAKIDCYGCGKYLHVTEFNMDTRVAARERGYRQSYCRECQRKYRTERQMA